MTRPIVVPLDSSPLAEAALPLAVAIAGQGDLPLHLVAVNEPPQLVPGVGGSMEAGTFDGYHDPGWVPETGERQQEYLDRIAGDLRDDGLSVEATVVDGLPATALREYAEEQDAALVVLATHGRGGLSRAWLGSTTDRLLRDMSVPMLIIRSSEDENGQPRMAASTVPRRVLVPLDGSPLAEQILGQATALGARLGWGYELVRVVPVPFVIGSPAMVHSLKVDDEQLQKRRSEAEAYLERVRGKLEAEGVSAETVVVEAGGGALAEAILDTAGDLEVDVIALATHGRGGLRRLVLGSVADKLIRAADVPLLVFRPEEE